MNNKSNKDKGYPTDSKKEDLNNNNKETIYYIKYNI